MSPSRVPLSACIAAILVLSAPAQAFQASNDLIVEPRGDGFFVPYRGKSAASDFWCAAGEYAQRQLGARPAARIWRTSEPPRRSGEGIAFAMSPANGARSTGVLVFGTGDGSLSVNAARNLCEVERLLER